MIIYKRPGWITDATIDRHGHLRIVSGDHRAEWHVIVDKQQIGVLQNVLSKRVGTEGKTTFKDEDVLQLFVSAYGEHTENPFEEIKQMLDQEGIDWKHEFWGDM